MTTISGMHTFSLSVKSNYTTVQNIVSNNERILKSQDKFCLNRCYNICTHEKRGVKFIITQSLCHPSWIKVVVNPSSLVAGEYCPTGLFNGTKEDIALVKDKLRKILDEVGINYRLKDFKLSRADLTTDHYYENGNDTLSALGIYKKSALMRPYESIPFKEYDDADKKFDSANKHSWTIACKSCAFAVYDKTYELAKRHKENISESILRVELRLMRKRIKQLTKKDKWEDQILELLKNQNDILSKFLHRIHQDFSNVVSQKDAIECIKDSGFQKRIIDKMIKLVKKTSDYESLAVAKKKMKISNKIFNSLLKKFYKLGFNPITKK